MKGSRPPDMVTEYGAKSDIGLKRRHNEDAWCVDPHLGLYVVCDGMGGGQAGEVASRLAVETIEKHVREASYQAAWPITGYDDPAYFRQTNRLASAIRLANHVIHAEAQHQPQYAGMGTTVVSAVLTGPILSIAHVGDSRMYLARRDSIQALTEDHSLVAEQVRQGLLTEEEAEQSPRRHMVTRALGVDATVDVELNEVPLTSGDVIVLCSDGLTRQVTPSAILQTLRRVEGPQAVSERLIEIANGAGGEDNTTVIVLMVLSNGRPAIWTRIRNRIFAC